MKIQHTANVPREMLVNLLSGYLGQPITKDAKVYVEASDPDGYTNHVDDSNNPIVVVWETES